MVAADALHGDSAAAATDEFFSRDTCCADLQTFFDHVELEVKASGSGGEDGEEELEWLSNKDAFPTVETMDWAGTQPRTKGVRQPRLVVAWCAAEGQKCWHCASETTPQWRDGPKGHHTLCNACGIRYKSGRLLPEYRPASSPTFSSELHSNWHSRVVKMRRHRGEAIETPLDVGGYGKERGEEGKLLSNKTTFLVVETSAPAGQRPRTKGLRRPRRALSWSPPPRPRTPAALGRRRSGRGGARVATQQVPGRGDDVTGRGADADEGCAAATAGGGVDAAAPRVLAAAAAGWRQSQAGDGMAVEQGRVANGGKDGPTFPTNLRHRIVHLLRAEVPAKASPTIAAGEGRAVGAGVEPPAPPQAPAPALAPAALAQRRCQHCGAVKTPQWREGPGGRRALCNACGVQYQRGRLLPEYRPASSPTFSMELHSNKHRRVLQLRRLKAFPVITAGEM